MKLSQLAIGVSLLVGAGGLTSVRAEVSVGDTPQEVLQTLGEPSGYIVSEDFQIYYFDRGSVIFRDGVVESHSIVSKTQAARRREARQQEQEAYQQEKAREREEARALREQMRGDPDFNALPPSARLAFWQIFQQKFPEIDVDLDYSVALQEARLAQAGKIEEQDARLDQWGRAYGMAHWRETWPGGYSGWNPRRSTVYPDALIEYYPRPPAVIHYNAWPSGGFWWEDDSDEETVIRHSIEIESRDEETPSELMRPPPPSE